MDDAAVAERREELAHALLGPLVLGGAVRLVRPFGGPLALRLDPGEAPPVADADLASRVSVARVRRARLLAPVDTVADLDGASLAMLAGLNDLLQVTNHHLASALTRGRHARLLVNLRWLCERIPAPRDVAAALGRHATFARALEIARTDSKVSWWTGSESFRGEVPPRRLLTWRELRRVSVDARKVPLADMAPGVPAVPPDTFAEVLALWLSRSPLTDIATATRRAPAFAWSASTLSLIASAPGKVLAFRALARQPVETAVLALQKAAAQVPAAYEEARRLADTFAAEAARGFEALAEPP